MDLGVSDSEVFSSIANMHGNICRFRQQMLRKIAPIAKIPIAIHKGHTLESAIYLVLRREFSKKDLLLSLERIRETRVQYFANSD